MQKFRNICFMLIVFLTISYSYELNWPLVSQRCFYSASIKAMGDAGIAYPIDISSGLINPALLYSGFRLKAKSKGGVTLGYGRDSLFNKNIIPAGIGYTTDNGAIGGFYRLLMGDRKKIQNEYVINFSGRMFGDELDENQNIISGAVDFGINVRYESFSWKQRLYGPFANTKTVFDSLDQQVSDTAIDSLGAIEDGMIQQKRLIVDVGIFQSNVTPNLDFALTMRNLIGYMWTEENPVLKDSTNSTRTATGDSVVNHTWYFSPEKSKEKGRLTKEYRTLTAGIVYHIDLGGGACRVNLPIDFEILGLFDKHVKNTYIFRGGIAATIGQRFIVRLGYSRTPGPIRSEWEEIKDLNVFTGGAGVSINPVTLNFYLADKEFGTTAVYDF